MGVVFNCYVMEFALSSGATELLLNKVFFFVFEFLGGSDIDVSGEEVAVGGMTNNGVGERKEEPLRIGGVVTTLSKHLKKIYKCSTMNYTLIFSMKARI